MSGSKCHQPKVVVLKHLFTVRPKGTEKWMKKGNQKLEAPAWVDVFCNGLFCTALVLVGTDKCIYIFGSLIWKATPVFCNFSHLKFRVIAQTWKFSFFALSRTEFCDVNFIRIAGRYCCRLVSRCTVLLLRYVDIVFCWMWREIWGNARHLLGL